MPRATYQGRYKGRRYYRVPVRVDCNDSRACATVARLWFWVVAPTATDAANWIRDNEPGIRSRAETEIRAYGPRGGEVYRYIGWYTAIGTALATARRIHPSLPFDRADTAPRSQDHA